MPDPIRTAAQALLWEGTVLDAGGGELRLLIDRDTDNYPEWGDRVRVVRATDQPSEDQP